MLKAELLPGEQPITLSTSEVCANLSRVNARKAAGPDGIPGWVRATLSRVNAQKAAGPDGIPGRVIRACAEQLTEVFMDIFNLSLAQSVVPTCFKSATIVPVPKHSATVTPSDFHLVTFIPIIAKCFKWLVLTHLQDCLPPTLDPHQFAYRRNWSTEDAISTAFYSALTHLDIPNTYVRMLFIDFSSAFNTVSPSKLTLKLKQLGIRMVKCEHRGASPSRMEEQDRVSQASSVVTVSSTRDKCREIRIVQ
ncbi:hypothetical protein QTP70_026223 [Hemibagrus guttatus]|uniref:Reverse transcriptase domain-containing protein n=1 Tax=Hemibagrus guttatus TaxID=175788 RepID=A0AAE0VCA4_9TELE|nr:hypothetical protein QTP70_026223 [Hemibagrus guttatus]